MVRGMFDFPPSLSADVRFLGVRRFRMRQIEMQEKEKGETVHAFGGR